MNSIVLKKCVFWGISNEMHMKGISREMILTHSSQFNSFYLYTLEFTQENHVSSFSMSEFSIIQTLEFFFSEISIKFLT